MVILKYQYELLKEDELSVQRKWKQCSSVCGPKHLRYRNEFYEIFILRVLKTKHETVLS
jgi:hypothetical protein